MDQNNALRSQYRIHCNVPRCGNYDPAVPNIRVLFQNNAPKSQTCTTVEWNEVVVIGCVFESGGKTPFIAEGVLLSTKIKNKK